jgi:hypothetical protein
VQALTAAEGSSTDNGFKEAARGLRSSFQRLANLQNAQQAMLTDQQSSSSDRSSGVTSSGAVSQNIDAKAAQALRDQGWTSQQIARGARLGDPGVLAAVAAASASSPDVGSFGGPSLAAPQSQQSVRDWGADAQRQISADGAGQVADLRARGASEAAKFVPVQPTSMPDAAGFMNAVRGVESTFGGEVGKSQANDVTKAGIAVMAASLSASDKKGLSGVAGLIGEGTGLSNLFGTSGLRSGSEFTVAMKDLLARSDQYPEAVAAVNEVGSKFFDRSLTDADLKRSGEVVSAALVSIRNSDRAPSSQPE